MNEEKFAATLKRVGAGEQRVVITMSNQTSYTGLIKTETSRLTVLLDDYDDIYYLTNSQTISISLAWPLK